MRRLLLAAIGVLSLAVATLGPTAVSAQGLPTWVRTYQQTGRDGCQYYISVWSDGDFHLVPWICPPGVVPLREDAPVPAVRSYSERGREGCIWNVTLWADRIYTGAPIFCPYGAVPVKPGTLPPAPVYAPHYAPYYSPYGYGGYGGYWYGY